MDVLSDVLGTVRLTGSLFFTVELHAPWSFSSPPMEVLRRDMLQKSECIPLFHIVISGNCWIKMKTGTPFMLDNGSVIILPHSCPHVICSNSDIRPVSMLRFLSFEDIRGCPSLNYGKNGTETQLICGYLLYDQRFNPLLGAVPEVIILSPEKEQLSRDNPELPANTLPIARNGWLDINLKHLAEEVKRKNAGSSTIIARLIELMYVEVLRRYMKNLPENSGGWLAAVRDHEVGKALRYLHAHPEEKWDVKTLALKVGVSRSAFAKRFTELTGEPPIHYLTHWRMYVTKSLLQQCELNLALVAEKVGYESDTAFNRAFKRYVGEPPVHWRNHNIN